MFFDSPVYIVFLALVTVVYWRLGWRGQNKFLFAASYFFYGWWDWRFVLLMFCSTAVDFVLANRIYLETNRRKKRLMLICSLIVNFGFLGTFKYFNFFLGSLSEVMNALGNHHLPMAFLSIVLPPGISFYTFQEVAYIVDVYHGKQKPARSFVDYGLFISLFPHLIAGPIQRPSHLLPQVQNARTWDNRRFFDGLVLILLGLFRKSVIADNCAILANAAFDGRFGSNLFSVLIGIYAFALQIYSDFAGYSDMARGSAKLLGFEFMVNFRQPYFASSLQDFWRRWHISLSTWLRDYLYIPLGGNRLGTGRTYLNLLATMVIGGFWHGANWTFIIWGAIHGGWLALERYITDGDAEWFAKRGMKWFGHVTTLLVVGTAWVFFRAASLRDALHFLGGLGNLNVVGDVAPAFIFLALLSGFLFACDWRLEVTGEEYPFQLSSARIPIATACGLMLIMVFLGATSTNAFIYFQF